MEKKLLVAVIGMCLGIVVTTVPGCVTNRVSLVDQGIVSVDTVPSEKVSILWADVYEDGEDVVVYGTLRRRGYTGYPMKTHVDVTISSPDGTVLEEARTPDIDVPRYILGKHTRSRGIRGKRFEVRFREVPQGSKINMVVHVGPHEDET
jgi:hypothetical protein